MDRSVERRFMVAEGEDVTLKCRITSKPAPLLPGRPVIRWFRNRIVVKTETQSTNESIYTVPKATWADGGKYSCIATNADVSASIDYIVMVKPEVSGSLTLLAPIAEIRVPAHAWFTLRCTAIGYPLPGIRWTLDGQPIGDGSSEEEPYAVSNGGLTLTVKNFTLKRAVFECLAENRAGTANETFVVATLG
ncbi:hemicentin-2 [Aphelenchoides avenae]|nr:hemicentin-2 [Aphelenchus avenae]